ncbi:MAG TPA: OB-fold domain-containing protein, partial [Acidimicrobiales bacterium]|nr:OB-fold domain-containing protein [Acidimicrobiales bacterium]
RPVCPRCWSDRVEATEVSGRGTIDLLTVVYLGTPTPGVDYVAGYPVAGVELVEQRGLRYVAGVVDCAKEDVSIGLPVELTWIERDGAPTPAFRVVRSDQ